MPAEYTMEMPLSDAHLLAIGRVAAISSVLEHFVSRGVWSLLRIPDQKGHVITAHLSLPARLDMLKALADMHIANSTKSQKFNRLIKRLRIASENRNDIIHAVWAFTETKQKKDVATLAKITVRGKLKTLIKTITPEDIENVSKEIWSATVELIQALQHFKLISLGDSPSLHK